MAETGIQPGENLAKKREDEMMKNAINRADALALIQQIDEETLMQREKFSSGAFQLVNRIIPPEVKNKKSQIGRTEARGSTTYSFRNEPGDNNPVKPLNGVEETFFKLIDTILPTEDGGTMKKQTVNVGGENPYSREVEIIKDANGNPIKTTCEVSVTNEIMTGYENKKFHTYVRLVDGPDGQEEYIAGDMASIRLTDILPQSINSIIREKPPQFAVFDPGLNSVDRHITGRGRVEYQKVRDSEGNEKITFGFDVQDIVDSTTGQKGVLEIRLIDNNVTYTFKPNEGSTNSKEIGNDGIMPENSTPTSKSVEFSQPSSVEDQNGSEQKKESINLQRYSLQESDLLPLTDSENPYSVGRELLTPALERYLQEKGTMIADMINFRHPDSSDKDGFVPAPEVINITQPDGSIIQFAPRPNVELAGKFTAVNIKSTEGESISVNIAFTPDGKPFLFPISEIGNLENFGLQRISDIAFLRIYAKIMGVHDRAPLAGPLAAMEASRIDDDAEPLVVKGMFNINGEQIKIGKQKNT